MPYDVSIVACPDYEPATARSAILAAVGPVGGLDWVTPGMKIAIKANLVAKMKPGTGAVTHPVLVTELCRLLIERGAQVVVGDSPGGPWNAAWVNAIYSGTGMRAVETVGAKLNHDFSQKEVSLPAGKTVQAFPFTAWLDEADCVIDFCKLKTHAMAGMSCAVKNFFGCIPGTRKPEFHYLHPRTDDFCSMLVDLNEYIRPRLTLVDAVLCMEGNGPTQGTPRHMGALLAARTPYAADLVCAHLIGIPNGDAGTVKASIARGLCPDDWRKLSVFGDPDAFAQPDFEKLPPPQDIKFHEKLPGVSAFLEQYFAPGPKVDKTKCVGCGKCEQVCPMGMAKVVNGKARLRRDDCIRCFCCQEFCPKGAITVHRSLIARLVTK